ncbi:Cof-type HAD-IIB family hydrolase [Endozoicomonas sp. SCSIO W0465]|uniref:Cof-type HAD-IIB family hydrolase n=1 Tax=Endozoicomonas sp. SCSIO W0465 TaxID=2918516 RepID=UPI0020755DCE|nr:Cof-type HAD-IIB family hydrolase [Endozoicomonas sp. SCSIO W0465]USE34859.1 Cof-type HAD-IIB family hydrolase [Endozoicomonas sp. SCSIO W0465]
MYPVVVSDLDGTLLTKQHELSPRTREVIQHLSEKGIKFIFATGRHFQDVERIREQLGVDMYLITSNGARVHNPNGEMIVQHDINPGLVHSLLSLRKFYEDRVHSNVYQGEQWLVEVEHEDLHAFSKESGFTYHLADFDAVETAAIQKIFFVAKSHADLLPLSDRFRELYGEQLYMTYSLPECFEIMASGVCKGTALAEVLKLKGYGLQDAITFGDGMNDVEMLSSVGKGVVMGNADPSLVNSLPGFERIGHCDDHSVAEYLARLYAL